MTAAKRSRKGLYVIGAGAAVSLWGGWVGLGGLAGFGSVTLFPGIPVLSRLIVDLAITLPFTMEAYAAVAVGFALDRTLNQGARRYALFTAIGSILMAMGAQAGFHLLTALHRHAAPWEVVMLVSWVPLAVFVMATGLYHLAERPGEPGAAPLPVPTAVEAFDEMARTIRPPEPEPEPWPDAPLTELGYELTDPAIEALLAAWARPDEPQPSPVPARPEGDREQEDDIEAEAAELFAAGGDGPPSPRPAPAQRSARPPGRPSRAELLARRTAGLPVPREVTGTWTPEAAGLTEDEARRIVAALPRNDLVDFLKVSRGAATRIKDAYGQPALAAANGSR